VLWVSHDLNEIRHAKNVITLTRHSSGSASHESA